MKSRVVEPQGTVLKVLINPSMSSEQIEKGDIYLNKQESKDNGNGVGGDKDRVIGGARVHPLEELHCSLNAISLPHHTTSVHPNVTMCVLKSYVASMHSRNTQWFC